ncbi:recombination protein O N-terminal domain-containing protein [Mycoplasma phocimorsus]|uniref:recombination protein O N-terminal domain-containing protein n=1 Tax=Mycoplasma phocimorsus TaxID=3045839 RepID=UPI0024BFC9E5|nr:recombination protein O N-terminal domain-containing protein [Mycoplasma phocimorsus]MDJ1648088.1 recombination protein O N-terminal domain-containing protein [Mycoplasma phocimorsus]MDJ1648977.1 recombination protein O N-terminal domain-containing protein [Mycoplasma phocimorsus]
MAAEKLIGIVVEKKDFNDYDQLVTFLCPIFNKKITFLAQGVRKINSKNAVNLQMFSIIEAEVFLSRNFSKISKLKKAYLLKEYDFSNAFVQITLDKVKFIFSNTERINNSFLKLYFHVLDKFKTEECNWWMSILLANSPLILPIRPSSIKCSECGSVNKLVQFSWHLGGMKCKFHSNSITPYNMLLNYYFLFNNFEKYVKSANIYQNELIQKELLNFFTENGYF